MYKRTWRHLNPRERIVDAIGRRREALLCSVILNTQRYAKCHLCVVSYSFTSSFAHIRKSHILKCKYIIYKPIYRYWYIHIFSSYLTSMLWLVHKYLRAHTHSSIQALHPGLQENGFSRVINIFTPFCNFLFSSCRCF